jgi:hypothetical protein
LQRAMLSRCIRFLFRCTFEKRIVGNGHAIDLETRSVAFSVADIVVGISVCHASPFERG